MLTPLNSIKSPIRQFFFCLVISLIIPIQVISQVQIWGVSQQGGSDGIGSVFNLYDDGTGYLLKSEFRNSVDGTKPQSSILKGQDGNYYGITSGGGDHNAGTIFKHTDSGFEVLYHLNASTDGSEANGDMIEISPGVFVGTTNSAGSSYGGTLFKYSLSQGFTILHSFESASHGSSPSGGIVFDSDTQNIYGTCSNGGSSGYGTSFSFNLTTDTYSVQHHFSGTAGGSYPQGGVVLAGDGMLYGTTQHGGSYAQGSIFKLNPQDETFEIIYSLNNATQDGRYPFGKLAEAENGMLMGTCNEGGSSANGTIFKVSTSGDFTRLRSMQSTNDGGYLKAGLCTPDGNIFYGITEFGGLNGSGTLYSITLDGDFTKIKDMSNAADGSNGAASLSYDGNNKLIGVGKSGGANNFGTIFTISIPENTVEKIHDFSVPLKGANPTSIFRVENTFYGVTESGGVYNTGTFYKTNPDGSLEDLHNFNADIDGQGPNGDLYRDDAGSFYGTTRFGGANSSGTIFKISPEGEFNLLYSFQNNIAQFPYGGVIKHSNGLLYGTTQTGGMYGDGVLYSLNDAGDFTVLYDFFSYFDGGSPEAALIEGSDGNIYGTNTQGGDMNGGTLFMYSPESIYLTVVHPFASYIDGESPKGKLLLHSDGHLYGTTTSGAAGGGALYRYSSGSGFEVLHSFNPETDGYDCSGGLSEDELGKVYGFCTYGGANGKGTSFVYSEASGMETVYAFTSESQYPTGTPALFFPECYDNSGCSTENECAVAVCNYGLCDEMEINPVFTLISKSDCEVGLDVFDLKMSINMDIHPGGYLIIENDTLELLEDVNSYTLTIRDLAANGNSINLVYYFEGSGCSGTIADLGFAPAPCPPTEVHFILDVGDLDVSEQGIFVGGSFQGWTPGENPMTLGEDGFWETTLTIGSGTHEFNFFNGPLLFNAEYVIGSCGTTGKRLIIVSEESQTLSFCWTNCEIDCSEDPVDPVDPVDPDDPDDPVDPVDPADPVGIEQTIGIIDFELIPNITQPGGNIVVIIPSNRNHLLYSVVNITGSVVKIGSIDADRTEVNTESMASGIYNFTLMESGRIIGVKRFVVQ